MNKELQAVKTYLEAQGCTQVEEVWGGQEDGAVLGGWGYICPNGTSGSVLVMADGVIHEDHDGTSILHPDLASLKAAWQEGSPTLGDLEAFDQNVEQDEFR